MKRTVWTPRPEGPEVAPTNSSPAPSEKEELAFPTKVQNIAKRTEPGVLGKKYSNNN